MFVHNFTFFFFSSDFFDLVEKIKKKPHLLNNFLLHHLPLLKICSLDSSHQVLRIDILNMNINSMCLYIILLFSFFQVIFLTW